MKKLTLFLICILIAGMQFTNAQTKSITGAVTSKEDGASIPGVSVMVKGTTLGTVTNLDGKYDLNVPVDAKTLVFSFIGMKNLEVEIGNQTSINVTMETDVFSVDEVVVVGYGVQKKREVTGAISQVKGDELKSLATPSFESQLAGRAAGVQVTSTMVFWVLLHVFVSGVSVQFHKELIH
jgi:TonB-dependent starch-binding outer membrane protein SusC